MEALCWIDIETTGLDPKSDKFLEIYVRLTDFNFTTMLDFQAWVNNPHDYVDKMDDVVIQMHETSGLFDVTRNVKHSDFYCNKPGNQLDIDFSAILDHVANMYDVTKFYPAGSSVHFDIDFLKALGLPLTMSKLSHRHFDVTTLKLFMQVQTGEFPEFPAVEPKHRAFSDIQSSIDAAKIICLPMVDNSLRAAHLAKIIDGQ